MDWINAFGIDLIDLDQDRLDLDLDLDPGCTRGKLHFLLQGKWVLSTPFFEKNELKIG